jgi:hypothetical protein
MDVIKAGNGFALPDDAPNYEIAISNTHPIVKLGYENAGHQFMPVPG